MLGCARLFLDSPGPSNQVFDELGAASCFAFSSFSAPFCSILSAARLIITSGLLIGSMLRAPKYCRRCYCALAVPIIPVEAAIMATGLPLKELSLVGLEAQFIVFLRTSDLEWSYSGAAIISALALLIFVLNSLTFWVVALLGLG